MPEIIEQSWKCKCRDLQATFEKGIYECEKCYKKWIRMSNDEWREFYENDNPSGPTEYHATGKVLITPTEDDPDVVVPYSHCILKDSV